MTTNIALTTLTVLNAAVFLLCVLASIEYNDLSLLGYGLACSFVVFLESFLFRD